MFSFLCSACVGCVKCHPIFERSKIFDFSKMRSSHVCKHSNEYFQFKTISSRRARAPNRDICLIETYVWLISWRLFRFLVSASEVLITFELFSRDVECISDVPMLNQASWTITLRSEDNYYVNNSFKRRNKSKSGVISLDFLWRVFIKLFLTTNGGYTFICCIDLLCIYIVCFQ